MSTTLIFDFDIRVTGRSPRGDGGFFKDMIADIYNESLRQYV
jgi:hypothetical protein